MLSKKLCVFYLVLFVSSLASAQSEVALREYFEGKTVVVKLEMPANKLGIDVFPESNPQLNFADYQRRIKTFGVSLRPNESVMITKIKVKEKNIEFQLGGGGYGTLGDDTATSVYIPTPEKTQREKNLERDLKAERDPAKRRTMQEELDDLRKRRSRESARLQSEAEQAEVLREESVRRRAAAAGSRFNLVFPQGVPARALEPGYIKIALKNWLDFGEASSMSSGWNSTTSASNSAAKNPSSSLATGRIRKGMTESEVRELMGEPVKREQRTAGDLRVEVVTFTRDGSTLEATFAEGILVRFKHWSD